MLPKNKNLKENSRSLRKNATKEEKRLWYDFLKAYPVPFNRQKIIGSYIVDFYCHSTNLVIELDGSQHYEGQAVQYDQERTTYFNELGLKVLRFSNQDVNKNFNGVCMAIHAEITGEIDPAKGYYGPAGG